MAGLYFPRLITVMVAGQLVLAGNQAIGQELRPAKPKGSNYCANLDPDLVNCWPASRMPINIYVYPAEAVPNYDPSYIGILKTCCDDWTNATDGKMTFVLVDKLPATGIELRFRSSDALSKSRAADEGYTQIDDDKQGIRHAIISIDIPNVTNKGTPALVKATILHEIGHALGVQGHSPNPKDIMFADFRISSVSTVDQVQLSEADKSTIAYIIRKGPNKKAVEDNPPDMPIGFQDTATTVSETTADLNDTAIDQMNAGKYAAAIATLNKCLGRNPHYDGALDTLQSSYYNWALESYNKQDYRTAASLFKGACDAIHRMSKQDRHALIETLELYAVCLHNTGDNATAEQVEIELKTLK